MHRKTIHYDTYGVFGEVGQIPLPNSCVTYEKTILEWRITASWREGGSRTLCECYQHPVPSFPFGAFPPLVNVCVLFVLRASQRWFGSGGWTRTIDLKDMSLASYQLLYPAL